jgi:hypothetical protein
MPYRRVRRSNGTGVKKPKKDTRTQAQMLHDLKAWKQEQKKNNTSLFWEGYDYN